MKRQRLILLLAAVAIAAAPALAQNPPGEQPRLGERVTQDDIASMTLSQIIDSGMKVFTTPFNKLDGYGDGPMDINDTVSPGGRPTLQGNGTFLRVNGLDSQTCLECHSIVSSATSPPTLGIGGFGSANNNAIIMPTHMDPADLEDLDTIAGFNGRFANPPFVFGAGGVDLLAQEMTSDLQVLRQQAIDSPGVPVDLWTKGVYFGSIVADGLGEVDTSAIEGIEPDLVVRPFGRKGEFASIRAFDIGAMQFHFGMQPIEVVGADVDDDGDGVPNEIMAGELSVLSAFISTLPRPEQDRPSPAANRGRDVFETTGCAGCHMPTLSTESKDLRLRYPEVETDPTANVFMTIDLSRPPMKFDRNAAGGIDVPLYSDLKRHDMGDALAESFDLADDTFNRSFVTARLWGIADSAPYLHDGRATTLTEAILYHGGEAQTVRDVFDALPASSKSDLLDFLRSLRTPIPKTNSSRPGRPGSPFEGQNPDAVVDFSTIRR